LSAFFIDWTSIFSLFFWLLSFDEQPSMGQTLGQGRHNLAQKKRELQYLALPQHFMRLMGKVEIKVFRREPLWKMVFAAEKGLQILTHKSIKHFWPKLNIK